MYTSTLHITAASSHCVIREIQKQVCSICESITFESSENQENISKCETTKCTSPITIMNIISGNNNGLVY